MADQVEQTTNEPQTRSTAIAAAIEVANKEAAEAAPNAEKAEKSEEESAKVPEKKAETKEPTEDELLAQQGKELILALRDPDKAGIIIEALAKHAGYSKKEVAAAAGDKDATKEIQDDILKVIKEEMGEEFDVVSERLAKALKRILPTQLEKSQEDIRAEFQRQEAEKQQGQAASVLSKLNTDFFGEAEAPENVTKEMSSFMDRVQPTASMSIKEYVEDAFHYAIGKLGLQKVDKVKQERTNKNRTDASSRLASERAPADGSLRQDDSKRNLTPDQRRKEAIQAAIESANKG